MMWRAFYAIDTTDGVMYNIDLSAAQKYQGQQRARIENCAGSIFRVILASRRDIDM